MTPNLHPIPSKLLDMTTTEFYSKFNKLANILQTFAYSLTKDMDRARDLYQETAYRAFKNSEKFKTGTNFKAWMMTIMKNIFINDYRRRSYQNTILDNSDNNYYINSGKQKVRNEGESNVMMDEIFKIINGLEESLKVPFLMYYNGYKYQEIADAMGLPLGTTKSKIFFARKELKYILNKRYQGREGLFC